MTAQPAKVEARALRLGCLLRGGNWNVPGHTLSVSTDALLVEVSELAASEAPPLGTQLTLQVFLPNRAEAVKGTVEVRSLSDERAAEVPSVKVGLKLVGPSAAASARFLEVLRDFRHTVVAVDADRTALRVIRQTLEVSYRVLTATRAAEALDLLREEDVSALLVGQQLDDDLGVGFLRRFSSAYPRSSAARLLTFTGDLNTLLQDGIDLSGAYYLHKPFRLSELEQAVHRGVEARALAFENQRLTVELERAYQQLHRENVFLRRRVEAYEGFEHLIGESVELRRSFEQLDRMRHTDSTVHLQGETGTGKELVARALHFSGRRASGPFIAQNCAGMSETLLQSTLFGHRKGAFTGAVRDHSGVFEQANGGTLFLDEVAELSPQVQLALLRALDGEVKPVGSSQPIKVDVRIISATHEDLRSLVAAGRFREDVYFRLVVLSVRLPPLRERAGDIPLLARHFLSLYCERLGKPLGGFDAEAIRLLERYPWPGNVRELENEIERVVVLAEAGNTIGLPLLSPHLQGVSDAAPAAAGSEVVEVPDGLSYDDSLVALEKALVQRAFHRSQGALRAAADLLKMERSRLGKVRARLGMAKEGEP